MLRIRNMTLALATACLSAACAAETVDYDYRFFPIEGGGAIQCVSICPHDSNIVIAGVDVGGVMRSEDGGITWLPANDGLRSEFDFAVSSVAFAPSKPGWVYIVTGKSWSKGTGIGAVFYSDDYGKTWNKLPENLTFSGQWVIRQRDNLIVVDPRDHQRLWVATVFNGVQESTDGGQTWTARGPENTDVLQALIALDDSCRTLLAAAKRQGGDHGKDDALIGVWQSTDAGQSWRYVLPDVSVFSLAASPSGEIIAAAECSIYRSTDQGATWSDFSEGLPPAEGEIRFPWFAAGADPFAPGRFLIAAHTAPNPFYHPKLFVREPGESHWRPVGAPLGHDPANTTAEDWPFFDAKLTDIYTPYRSEPGSGWHGFLNWFAACPTSIKFDPHQRGVVYLTDWYTVNKSTDGGAAWRANNTGLVTTVPVRAVWDMIDPDYLYLGMIDVGFHEAYINDDGSLYVRSLRDEVPDAHGQPWQFEWQGDVITLVGMNNYPGGNWLHRRVNHGPWVKVYDNQYPGQRRTGINMHWRLDGEQATVLARLTTGALLISRDAGQTWRPYSDELLTAELQQQTVLPCPEHKNSRWYVTVGGQGYEADTLGQWRPSDLADASFFPDNPQIAWRIQKGVPQQSRDVLMKSTDGGANFSAVFTYGWGKASGLTLTSSADIVYAWSNHWSGYTIHRTVDGGQTWQQLVRGPGYQIQTGLFPDPRRPERFLLGPHGLGFWLAEPK